MVYAGGVGERSSHSGPIALPAQAGVDADSGQSMDCPDIACIHALSRQFMDCLLKAWIRIVHELSKFTL